MDNLRSKANNFRNYFLVVLIILFEDSPFFILINKQVYWLIIFCLLILLNSKNKIVNKMDGGVRVKVEKLLSEISHEKINKIIK